MADIELPQLGESVTEGTITQWFKQVGDAVAEDEPLFEVSTDKVDSEVPSPSSGYLAEILVAEGDTVDVGTKIAVLSDTPPGQAGAGVIESVPAAEPVKVEPVPEPTPAPLAMPAAPAPIEVVPVATPVPAPVSSEPIPVTAAAEAGAPLLSPVVRRLLQNAGVDGSAVVGTGTGGRVTRSDVEEYLRASGGGQVAPAAFPRQVAARPAPATARVAAASAAAVGTDNELPLNKIRKITAEHMVRSLETSAHAYVSTEVDFEAVDRVRKASREQFKAEEGVSLTFLPFVARALVDALGEFPQVNASMGDDPTKLVVHGSVNLGIAVDLDHAGLIVPVIHEAQDQRLRAIARHIPELAARAKDKKLTADDVTGGTVTITNVGSTGNAFLLPIINQPQVMILATDGIKRRPVVVTDADGGESIAIHSVGNLTLGWDHRAFDGAYAAQFLARIGEILETRDWATEL